MTNCVSTQAHHAKVNALHPFINQSIYIDGLVILLHTQFVNILLTAVFSALRYVCVSLVLRLVRVLSLPHNNIF